MKHEQFTMITQPNGGMTITRGEAIVTFHPDGTVAISTSGPIQLTGMSVVKLENSVLPPQYVNTVLNALNKGTIGRK